jgi:hypothetical protein
MWLRLKLDLKLHCIAECESRRGRSALKIDDWGTTCTVVISKHRSSRFVRYRHGSPSPQGHEQIMQTYPLAPRFYAKITNLSRARPSPFICRVGRVHAKSALDPVAAPASTRPVPSNQNPQLTDRTQPVSAADLPFPASIRCSKSPIGA